MRSDKVFEALHTLQNRYMLCQIASKATRKFHKPNTRIQDTTNDVLNRISDNERASAQIHRKQAGNSQHQPLSEFIRPSAFQAGLPSQGLLGPPGQVSDPISQRPRRTQFLPFEQHSVGGHDDR